MRLSKIKLAGFKSFVDPTTLDLKSNLTAVVGPNGCGKSNIIDAIRWVMGESSAKNLRGGALTDVIFNGSSSRKPIGQASVELVFDNSDGTLGGEYAGFSEIALKRQVTRDGQSSYFINGQRARRKDITGIFLGTGLGPRSYAIIEQGMISRVIEAKPEDMRNFIEEAAGVSKYKERRRETENRIRHTHDNLNRLNDIRTELEKQLENLEKQAAAAKKYQTLKGEQKTLEVELTAMSWQRLQKDIEVSEQAIREITNEIEKHQSQFTHLRSELEEAREHQIDRNDHLNEVQRQFYSVGSEISKIEQGIENIAEQVKTLEENQVEEQNALARAQSSLTQDKEKISMLEQQLAQLTPEEETLSQQIEIISEQFEEKEAELESWRMKQEEVQQTLNQATQSAEKQKTNIEHLEKQVQQSDVRLEKLRLELSSLEDVEEKQSITHLESELTNLNLQQTQLSNQLDDKRRQHSELKSTIAEVKAQIKQQDKSRQTIKDELTTLQAIQAVRLGKENDHINAWVEEKGLVQNKRLAEVIQVDTQWQVAVETLLSAQMDAIYLEQNDLRNLLEDADLMALSGLSVVVQDSQAIEVNPTSVLTKIKNPEALNASLKAQLNNIYFVTDLEEAFQVVSQQPQISVITQKGIWLGQGFIKIPAQIKESEQSLLEMTQRIKQLEIELDEAQEKYHALTDTLEQNEASEESLADAIDDEMQTFTSLKQKSFALQGEIKIKRNKLEQAHQRTLQISEEIKELETSIKLSNENISKSREILQQSLDEMASVNELFSDNTSQKDILEQARRQLRDHLKEHKDKHHQVALQSQGASSELKTLTQSIQRFDEQISSSSDRLKRIEQSIAQAKEPEERLREELTQALDRRLQAEELLNQARDDMHAGDMRIRTLESSMQEEQNTIEDMRSRLEKDKLDWQTIKVHLETANETIRQKEINVQSVLETLSDEAQEIQWQERLERIERQIARLGAINLTAIEEFDSALERKTYLDKQNDDLNQALTTLENAIKKIDKETKDRFKETFDKINSAFQNLFPRLFGGGESSIVLTDDDLLNTGVSVMARPPGKKNASIQLLSGGEKALTAVAFVFSIFLLNPAPFCILDEVDAPLDDNNVGRFCNLVKEMSETIQFVYISHNKITIALGEQLHGVTMREAGVSRLVSVDIDEAVELAS